MLPLYKVNRQTQEVKSTKKIFFSGTPFAYANLMPKNLPYPHLGGLTYAERPRTAAPQRPYHPKGGCTFAHPPICSLFRNHFTNLDFGSGWEPLEDGIFGIHLRQVWTKFPSPTLSVSLETAIPTNKDVGMTTIGTVGIVGSHSFFLSFVFLSLADFFGLSILNTSPVIHRLVLHHKNH
jgi:hypothetical protein